MCQSGVHVHLVVNHVCHMTVLKKTIFELVCCHYLNWRDMPWTLPKNGQTTQLFSFPPSSKLFLLLYPFHTLHVHRTICVYFYILGHI